MATHHRWVLAIVAVVTAGLAGPAGCSLTGAESARDACLRLQDKLNDLLAACSLPTDTDPADCDIFSDFVACSALTELVDCVEPLTCTSDGLDLEEFLGCFRTPGLLTSGATCEGALAGSPN